MKPVPFSRTECFSFHGKRKKKRKYNFEVGKGGIIRGQILMRENRANRQPQFLRVHMYCRQLHNLLRREMSHKAVSSTTVNSFEASSSPLTLHYHPQRDTPLSSLRASHWRKLCAVLSPLSLEAGLWVQAGTLDPQWESCDLSQCQAAACRTHAVEYRPMCQPENYKYMHIIAGKPSSFGKASESSIEKLMLWGGDCFSPMQLQNARALQLQPRISVSGHGQTGSALPEPKHMVKSLRKFGKIQRAALSCLVCATSAMQVSGFSLLPFLEQ